MLPTTHFTSSTLLSQPIPRPHRPTLFPYTTLFRSRNWRPGDRYQPRNGGSQKLKTLFQQARIPFWEPPLDRKSTRLNSSHQIISYAVFCLKKKKQRLLESG